MALSHAYNEPAPTVTASVLDWLILLLPSAVVAEADMALRSRYGLAARRRLQRQAADRLSRGECGLLASLILAGEWDRLARLMDRLERTA